MPQMVEHTHEQHEIEFLAAVLDVIDRKLPELDVDLVDLGGKPRLRHVIRIGIDAEHALGPAPLHLDRVKAAVTADVEHAVPPQVGNGVGEAMPFDGRIVAEEMRGRGPHALEVDVVKPRAERLDPLPDFIGRQLGGDHRTSLSAGSAATSRTRAVPRLSQAIWSSQAAAASRLIAARYPCKVPTST